MPNHPIALFDRHPDTDTLAEDVLQGLRKAQKSIPPKYFYDAEGSRLFEQITQLPEYYPTRTEMALLETRAGDVAARAGTGDLMVEPGSGSCIKAGLLFDSLKPCGYVPMDISREHLLDAAKQVAKAFPWLPVYPVCADFTQEMPLPPGVPQARRLAFFPGSSIGNFHPSEAVEFLRLIATMVGAGGYLLIGVDLKKDRAILDAAYDDAQGVTAAFNLNLLAHVNRELGANFDLDSWSHKAFYNSEEGRIEMHLVSRIEQQVRIGDEAFDFLAGESIHTENSYKYHVDEFQAVAAQAGFVRDSVWVDAENLFSLHLLKVVANAS